MRSRPAIPPLRSLGCALGAWFVAGAVLGAASRAVPVAVSPGAADGFSASVSICPTFSWGPSSTELGYELAVFRVEGEPGAESLAPVFVQRIDGGASSWTPSLDRCLSPGGRYAWMVRAAAAAGFPSERGAGSEWSAPLFFEVGAPSLSEVARALEIVQGYLAQETLAPPETIASEEPRPSRSASQSRQPELAGTVAIEGSTPDSTAGTVGVLGDATATAGETAGVHGQTASADGAGVKATNASTGGGADLLLDGGTETSAALTEAGIDKPDAAEVETFGVTNSLGGGLTLDVDGQLSANSASITGQVSAGSYTGDGSGLTGVAALSHAHSGADITSGTVGEPRVDALLARDAEVLSLVLAGDGSGSTLDADLLDGLEASALTTRAGFVYGGGSLVDIETEFPFFTEVSSVSLAAGKYVVIANVGLILSDQDVGGTVHTSAAFCQLKLGSSSLTFTHIAPPDINPGATYYAAFQRTNVTLIGAGTLASAGTAKIECAALDADGNTDATTGSWVTIAVDSIDPL